MLKKNSDVRQLARQKKVALWQIAEQLGTSDSGFSRMMRKELSDTEKQRVFGIIDDLSRGDVA